MNTLKGHIRTIEVSGGLSVVSVVVGEQITLKAIVIETPETAAYLKTGGTIKLMFKETEVVIGTPDDHKISLQNRIYGRINKIHIGQLLCRLDLDTPVGQIGSIISTQAVKDLGLKENSPVCAMVKLNEMMLSE